MEVINIKDIEREMRDHCRQIIIPYWKDLIDQNYGGYFGYVDFNLKKEERADKGAILNSRILYFFSRAAMIFEEKDLLLYADWAYQFLIKHCWDKENGGVYWMLQYDGCIKEDMKHTYNQAFAIYALSVYYLSAKIKDALDLALKLFQIIEEKCVDSYGYMEAFTVDWQQISNEKLSENGLLAEKTMNTLLHLLEAYTLLYQASKKKEVGERLQYILELFQTKVWNREEGKLEVFFDKRMNSISSLYSYGHDIEASWLIDYAYETLERDGFLVSQCAYTGIIAENIVQRAWYKDALNNECFNKTIDYTRVWWVQAEAVVGFYHAYEKTGDRKYLDKAAAIWEYIKAYFVDRRAQGEWFWDLNVDGEPASQKPITEPWKCPYHNGRMCMEIIARERKTKD